MENKKVPLGGGKKAHMKNKSMPLGGPQTHRKFHVLIFSDSMYNTVPRSFMLLSLTWQPPPADQVTKPAAHVLNELVRRELGA